MEKKHTIICNRGNVSIENTRPTNANIIGLWTMTVVCGNEGCPNPVQTFTESGFNQTEAEIIAKNHACRTCQYYR